MKKNLLYLSILLSLVTAIATGCSPALASDVYTVGTEEEKAEVQDLYTRLAEQDDSWESRYIIVNRITEILYSNEEPEKLNMFLSTYVENNPEDPFNAYYLFLIAQNYLEMDAQPFAEHYFSRIHTNFKDVFAQGQSVHFLCLTNLIELTENTEKRILYFKELLSRFPEQIDPGKIYYELATDYEKIGQWDLAFQAYNQFLAYPKTEIPEVVDVFNKVREKIEFYKCKNKFWVKDDLDSLVGAIKSNLYRGDVNGLKRYMSDIGFFTNSWEHDTNIPAPQSMKENLGVFMTKRILYSSTLDGDSNDQEAFLRTSEWSYRIRTWYLYFEKIDFPADPEIHGKWQWKGIYLGKKHFSGDLRTD